jgi:hypothetical protein
MEDPPPLVPVPGVVVVVAPPVVRIPGVRRIPGVPVVIAPGVVEDDCPEYVDWLSTVVPLVPGAPL